MIEKNTVIITTEEYQNLLKCKIFTESIFNNCSVIGDKDIFFKVDERLQKTLFPDATRVVAENALKKEKEE